MENIQDLLTCYYKDNKRHLQEEFLCEKIQNDCIHKKIIFLNINAINYCLDRKEEGNYATHGTCAILIPKNNEYHLYYMNPHGDVMKSYTYFEEYITRKRCKKYDFHLFFLLRLLYKMFDIPLLPEYIIIHLVYK